MAILVDFQHCTQNFSNHSLLIEYKGGAIKKLTTHEGGHLNATEPFGGIS